jgi:hypothetical protein
MRSAFCSTSLAFDPFVLSNLIHSCKGLVVPESSFLLSLPSPSLLPLLLAITSLPGQRQFRQCCSVFGHLVAMLLVSESPHHQHRSALCHLMATLLPGQHQCHQPHSAFGCLVVMSLLSERLRRQHCSALRHHMATNDSAVSYLLRSSTSTHRVHCPGWSRPSLCCQLTHQISAMPLLSLVIVDC